MARDANRRQTHNRKYQQTEHHLEAHSGHIHGKRMHGKHESNSTRTSDTTFVLVYISVALLVIAPFTVYCYVMLSKDDSIYIAWWVTILCFTGLTMIASLIFRQSFETLIEQHLRVHWQSSGYGMPWRWKFFKGNADTRQIMYMNNMNSDTELDSLMPRFTLSDLLMNSSQP